MSELHSVNQRDDAPIEIDSIDQEEGGDGGTGGTAVATVPEVRTQPDRRVDVMPPWKVLLHNDDLSAMEDVVKAIKHLTSLTLEESVTCMLEAHEQGVALLLTTHKEHAELLVEQFCTKLLTVTIEPDR